MRDSKDILILKGEKDGIAYWNAVHVPRFKQPLLYAAIERGVVCSSNYGIIIDSGWGAVIPKKYQ